VKGVKVVKLAISTVLASKEEEIIRLCGVSLDNVEGGLVEEWCEVRGSEQLLKKLKEKVVDPGMLKAVQFHLFAFEPNILVF